MPKLTASQARIIAKARSDHDRDQAAAAASEKHWKEIRDRYFDRVPLDEDIHVGEFVVKASTPATAEGFSLKGYREAGHEVTAEMQPFVSGPGTRRQLSIKPNDERKARGLGLADAVVKAKE